MARAMLGPVRLLAGVSAVAAVVAAITPMSGAAAQTATGPTPAVVRSSTHRPTALPLLRGATGGQVIGGRGDAVLLGGVTVAGATRPVLWRRHERGWGVTDLSSGGRLAGNANSEDRRGDILINDESNNEAWVRTADGVDHPLRTVPGEPGGVYARQINERGQIAGAVFGPGPAHLSSGAIWSSYRAKPRLVDPLPFPGSEDSLLLGLNDHGSSVGNSDNADYSDVAGGLWTAGSTTGRVLPALGGSHHSFPFKITDRDLVVGEAANSDFSRDGAAVWVRGALHYLGTAAPTDDSASLLGVAENGRAVGVSRSADGKSSRCIYWRPGQPLRVLPPLSGDWRTGGAIAHYVSSDGLVGGDSLDRQGDDVPVVWPNADLLAIG